MEQTKTAPQVLLEHIRQDEERQRKEGVQITTVSDDEILNNAFFSLHVRAMEAYADQYRNPVAEGEKLYHFVKASERLPQTEDDYYIIGLDGTKSILYHSGTNQGNTRWLATVDTWLEELTPTVEKNEAGHEAQKMMNVLRVFNQQGLEEALKYYPEYRPVLLRIHQMLTPTVAPSETKTACTCKYPSYNAMTDRCTVCGKLYYKEQATPVTEGSGDAFPWTEQRIKELQAELAKFRKNE